VSAAVQGVAETQRNLRTLREKLRKDIRDEIFRSAQAVQRAARDRAPVGGPYRGKKARSRRPGTVRDAISIRLARTALWADVYVKGGTARGPVFYARFQEFGRRGQPARPFLFPAFEMHRAGFESRIAGIISRAMS
jgi:HK97 gp10 family phage protein